jgi:hypothetical protein
MAQVTREVLERYLAELAASTLSVGRRNADIGAFNRFLQAIRQRHWDDHLPADAVLYLEDFIKHEPGGGRLPGRWPSTSWPKSKTRPTWTAGLIRQGGWSPGC